MVRDSVTVVAAFRVDEQQIGAVARTEVERKKVVQLKKESQGLSKLKSTGFLIRASIDCFCTVDYDCDDE
jgi:hypothetical protein